MSMNTSAKHDLFVFHRSYFSGKMLAYMRYKEIPHNAIYGTRAEHGPEIIANTGLRQMPVIRTAEGQWLSDTTPMIEWFEKQYPTPAVIPGDPVMAFFTRLLEDYADEWMWRPAVYYRWILPSDRTYYGHLFATEFIGGFWAKWAPLTWIGGKLIHKHQRDKFLKGDGMTAENRAHVEAIYTNTLDRLEAIFQAQPYLLGDKPSLADFGFFGSMFWHFSNDPLTNRIMQNRAPGVYEWVARLWNMRASKVENDAFSTPQNDIPTGWEPLLRDICEAYLPYLAQNAESFEAGTKRFDLQVQGYLYPKVHVSPYRVWCRERLQAFLNELTPEEKARVQAVLDPLGGWAPLTENPHITSNWDPEGIAPLCRPGKVPLLQKLLAPFTGSNHVRSTRAWGDPPKSG